MKKSYEIGEGMKKWCLRFISKQKLLIFFLLFFSVGVHQLVATKIVCIESKTGAPYFDSQGRLKIISSNPQGMMKMITFESETLKVMSVKKIFKAANIESIQVKTDRLGKTWVIWEKRQQKKSDLYLALLQNNNLVHPIYLTLVNYGFNFSPCLEVSFQNELWLAWINYSQKKYSILVKNITTGHVWSINPTSSSLHSPRLIMDGTQRLWLFWVGRLREHDEILYTYFDGQSWHKITSLNQDPTVPHFSPSVWLDVNGFPHLIWSSYDHQDYELYHSSWQGDRWQKEKPITHNRYLADTSPSSCLFRNSFPIIAWLRWRYGFHEICLAYKTGNQWNPEIVLAKEKEPINSLKLITNRDNLGIFWQTETKIKTTLIPGYELTSSLIFKNKIFNIFPKHPLKSVYTFSLDNNKYIGFGNSITYGIINYEPAPEKGYIPRLEALIDNNIRESQVINRGIGGEKTAEGLSRINTVINEDQAKTIFLMEGTNDIKDFEISVDTTAFNLQAMAKRCLNFGLTVFLSTIIPKEPWDGLIKERILNLNQRIESIASSPRIRFVDQFEVFFNYPTGWPRLYSDATHPNEKGYQLMAETWYEALVESMPAIELDKTSLSFEAKQGGSNPSPQTFKIRNSGEGRLCYQLNVNQTWLNVSPINGDSKGEWDEIEVAINISGLSIGQYQGTILVTADNASNSPQLLTVDLIITGPTIELNTNSLSFEGIKGESNPPPQTFKIRNSGDDTLKYQISDDREWITVSPNSGNSQGEWDEIEVKVDISALSQGQYQGTISVTSDRATNSPQLLTVELIVAGPIIELNKDSLTFVGIKGQPTPSQAFKIKNSGKGTLYYQLTPNKKWITITPNSGDSQGEWDKIKVAVDISKLAQGQYQGIISLTSDNAANSPKKLHIYLTVQLPPLFPPINFQGEKKENRSLSQLEYIIVLSWGVHPLNKNIIKKYRIFLLEGKNKKSLAEVNNQTFEYWHRNIAKDKVYRYALTVVDKFGRESEPVKIEVK